MRNYRKTVLNIKLDMIYTALCDYLDEVQDFDVEFHKADIKLRYAVILSAISDLHEGSELQRADAVRYFESDVYKQHALESLLPKWMLSKIVNNPLDYARKIKYATDADDSYDISNI